MNVVLLTKKVLEENRVFSYIEINEIINDYINKHNLGKYVNNVIVNTKGNDVGYYDYSKKELVINYENLMIRNNDKISYLEMDDPDYYCSNRNHHLVFHILASIYHELCHVEQNVYLNSHFTSNSGRELVYKINNRLQSNKMFYNRNHDYFPSERESDLFGYRESLSVFDKLDIDPKDKAYFHLYFIMYEELNGYDLNSKICCPLYNIVKPDPKLEEMDLSDRINFGIKLSRSEIISIYNETNEYLGIINAKSK